MYDILSEDDASRDPALGHAFATLRAGSPGSRLAVVRASPGSDGDWGWLDSLHHDVAAALRSFRYLAAKAQADYNQDDPRGQKVLESIERHLQVVETLKRELIDRILPLDGAEGGPA